MLTNEIEQMLGFVESLLKDWRKVDQFTFKHDKSNCFFVLKPTLIKYKNEIIVSFQIEHCAFTEEAKRHIFENLLDYKSYISREYDSYIFSVKIDRTFKHDVENIIEKCDRIVRHEDLSDDTLRRAVIAMNLMAHDLNKNVLENVTFAFQM